MNIHIPPKCHLPCSSSQPPTTPNFPLLNPTMSFTLESLEEGTAEEMLAHMQTWVTNCTTLANTGKAIRDILRLDPGLPPRESMRAHTTDCSAAVEAIEVLKTAYFRFSITWPFSTCYVGAKAIKTLTRNAEHLNDTVHLFNGILDEF